jgi:hypothetical protein
VTLVFFGLRDSPMSLSQEVTAISADFRKKGGKIPDMEPFLIE